MAELRWNNVWITGASSGIGLEFARLLDGNTAHIAISARSADRLNEAANRSKTMTAHPLDVTNRAAAARVAKAVEASAGPIDLAVLNAGLWQEMSIEDLDPAMIDRILDVNYRGVINCLAALLPGMIARGSGHIAIVASVAGYRGLPKSIAYGPTKAALINLAETLRTELASKGIIISVINPGFVDTPMTQQNTFPMPGIIPAAAAAKAMLAGLERGHYEIAFPRFFALAMKLLRLIPNPLYFWLVKRFVSR